MQLILQQYADGLLAMLIRCAVHANKGKVRQYTAFALLSLAVATACGFAYPHVRRGQLLVVASERLWAQGKVELALNSLREALRHGEISTGSADGMLDAALKVGEGRIARDLALFLIDKGRPVASGLVGAGKAGESAPGRSSAPRGSLRRGHGPVCGVARQ